MGDGGGRKHKSNLHASASSKKDNSQFNDTKKKIVSLYITKRINIQGFFRHGHFILSLRMKR